MKSASAGHVSQRLRTSCSKLLRWHLASSFRPHPPALAPRCSCAARALTLVLAFVLTLPEPLPCLLSCPLLTFALFPHGQKLKFGTTGPGKPPFSLVKASAEPQRLRSTVQQRSKQAPSAATSCSRRSRLHHPSAYRPCTLTILYIRFA